MVDDRIFPCLIPVLPKNPVAVNVCLFPRLTVPPHQTDIANFTTTTLHNGSGGIGTLDVRKRQRRNEEEEQLLLASNHVEKKRPRPSSDHRTALLAAAAPRRQQPPHPLIRSSQSSSSVLRKGAAAAQRQKQPPRSLIRSSLLSSSSSPTASLQSYDESKAPPTESDGHRRHREKAVKDVSHNGVLVALESDGDYLTRYQVVLRQCLEFFTATVSDVETSVQGRKHKLQLGQVRV
jgi:hypothetical protein